MKRYLLLLCFLAAMAGCDEHSAPLVEKSATISDVRPDKKGESTAFAYRMCSKEKKLYMQKYVKGADGQFHRAGVYKLGQGISAFPLKDLDKYAGDEQAVSSDVVCDPCPYCGNTKLVHCNCGKDYCESEEATSGTCPWCGHHGFYQSGTWKAGGGG